MLSRGLGALTNANVEDETREEEFGVHGAMILTLHD